MIPQTQDRTIVSGGVRSSTSFEISKDDTSHIMTILRDTLYSDKIMAVLREYGANAWDEHRKMGKADVPIQVTLPTVADPTLRIRDLGPGLSPDDVERIFTKYGASTKRDDNVAVGMLGIGSKSGFAYSDSFTVTSWHGGWRREYVAVIDSSQKGKMDLLHEECIYCGWSPGADHPHEQHDRVDAETGVEISLAVRPQDIREFESRARRLFQHFVPQPKINTELPKAPEGKRVNLDGRTLGIVSEETGWENRGKWTAVMGCVPYRVDLAQLGKVIVGGEHHAPAPCASSIGGVLYFDIGELQVAASREELKYGDGTRLAIITRINTLIDEYVKQMLEGIEKLNPWERRLRIRTVDNLGLPVPRDHHDFKTSWVDLKPLPSPTGTGRSIVRLTCRNYNGTQTESSHVRVERSSRIVVKDDKRTIKGFNLTQNDLLVSPDGALAQSALVLEVRRMIKAANIEGIPVVNLSTIPWTAPPKDGPRAYRDPAKAKAQMLVLDTKTADFGATPLSRHWAVVSRAAKDEDVYVVLDSYRVSATGLPTGDFYEQWQADDRLLKSMGLELPPIIGYKEMAAKPVIRSKLKGTEYSVWRGKGMVNLLKTHSGMAILLAAIENGGESGYDMDVRLLTDSLGEGHAITRLAIQVNTARKTVTNADKKLLQAARYVRSATKIVDATEGLRKEIADRYPLIRACGEGVFQQYGSHKDAWVDYVKMVDLMEKFTKPEEESKENAA